MLHWMQFLLSFRHAMSRTEVVVQMRALSRFRSQWHQRWASCSHQFGSHDRCWCSLSAIAACRFCVQWHGHLVERPLQSLHHRLCLKTNGLRYAGPAPRMSVCQFSHPTVATRMNIGQGLISEVLPKMANDKRSFAFELWPTMWEIQGNQENNSRRGSVWARAEIGKARAVVNRGQKWKVVARSCEASWNTPRAIGIDRREGINSTTASKVLLSSAIH